MPASTDQFEMSGAAFVPVCVKVHGSSPPRKRWGTLIQSAIAKTVPWPASDCGFAYKATSVRCLRAGIDIATQNQAKSLLLKGETLPSRMLGNAEIAEFFSRWSSPHLSAQPTGKSGRVMGR